MFPTAARIRSQICIAVVALACLACSKDPEASAAIRSLIDARQSEPIRLVDATPFAWDQVYLFSPYAPRDAVCATLRLDAQECERRVPFECTDDGVMSLAFLAKGELVHYMQHRRINGDFTPVPSAQPLTPQTAVFRVVRENGARGPSGGAGLVLASTEDMAHGARARCARFAPTDHVSACHHGTPGGEAVVALTRSGSIVHQFVTMVN